MKSMKRPFLSTLAQLYDDILSFYSYTSFYKQFQAKENSGNRHTAYATVLINIDSNGTIPDAQKSQTSDTDKTYLYVAIAVTVILVLVIAVLVVFVVYAFRKFRKNHNRVDIEQSPATSKETLSQSERSKRDDEDSKSEISEKTDIASKVDPLTFVPQGRSGLLPPLKKPEKADKSTQDKIKRKRKKKKKNILKRAKDEETEMPNINEQDERTLIE